MSGLHGNLKNRRYPEASRDWAFGCIEDQPSGLAPTQESGP